MASKTPKKKRLSDVALPAHMSPCNASPGRSPTKGQLTGTPRKIKDNCADWYNYTDKWNTLNCQGHAILNKLASIKLESVIEKEVDSDDVVFKESVMPAEMEGCCEKLDKIYQNMVLIVSKLERLTESLTGIVELCHNSAELSKAPLFQTWDTGKFAETSVELVKMYKKELSLKQKLLQNVAHVSDRNVMMVYTAAWSHQPYITDGAALLMESMLTETGHR